MKKQLLSALLLTVIGTFSFSFINPVSAPGEAAMWNLDKVHSSVNFSVRHFFTPVDGQFDNFESTFKFDPEHLHASSINFSVDVNSINTKNEKRDGHLKSGDFFDSAKFPKMIFKTTQIVKDGNSYVAIGDMTIKDVTKKMEIPFEFLGAMDHPMMAGSKVAGFRAEFTINRNDFKVGAGSWAETAVIGGEVSVVINLEVNKPA